MNRISKVVRAATVAASFVFLGSSLGGCALLDVASEPAPRFFTLTPPTMQTMATQTPVQLAVRQFSSSTALDTSRIVYQPSENEIKYYAGARWADQAPAMISRLIVETLEKSGAFAAVSETGGPGQADYTLAGEVRRFAAMPTSSEEKRIDVVLLARLIENSTNRIVGTKEFSVTVSSTDGRMDNVIGAYNAALGSALSKISVWTAATLKDAKPVS